MSPTKYEILQTFLLHDRSVKPIQVSKEVGKKFPSVMMHIIGLTRMGYVISPEKGFYTITTEGKRCLGLPEVTKELARKLLVGKPYDRAFHFYLDIDKPLEAKAHNLQAFNALLKTIPVGSIDFHMKRGDFQAWFEGIGDLELAKKAELLRTYSLCGEALRRKLQIMTINRIMALAKIAGYSVVKK
jgi:hypothetical protein